MDGLRDLDCNDGAADAYRIDGLVITSLLVYFVYWMFVGYE